MQIFVGYLDRRLANLVLFLIVRHLAGHGERHAPLVVTGLVQDKRILVIARFLGRQLIRERAVVSGFLFRDAKRRDQLHLYARQRRTGYCNLIRRHALALRYAGHRQGFCTVSDDAFDGRAVHAVLACRQRHGTFSLFFQLNHQREFPV